eukprot:CAMPEP_0170527406 /NCGR_PEP_ID=MMETSP0209-20121228/12875_1 /TAXON_ID=665100 ORGANISM="Litonotus pictus, Strain P1" /NCGR_SAMPLE_ID=MMETSP0209 /ASSEMBLY_ACC=CAM_ASM_000301 /LENGTH=634 /DNA_ID=CAMNT_0010817899 /DNA_START=637 /DNA_END=2541 /DNA_ORIENTATION=+
MKTVFSDTKQESPPVANLKALEDGVYSFELKANEEVKSSLLGLDNLGLYLAPSNNSQRGGRRFIFSSNLLSEALTKSIKGYLTGITEDREAYKKLTEDPMTASLHKNLSTFEYVNYVFRYNKFQPKDNKFSMHYDLPYYNKNKSQISVYTLLIYLTGGKNDSVVRFPPPKEEEDLNKKDSKETKQGNPPLSNSKNSKVQEKETKQIEEIVEEVPKRQFQEVNISSIDTSNSFYCVLFDHALEHEGKPFLEGDKLFIRSELIVHFEKEKTKTIDFNSMEAKLFNSACYNAKQSLFNAELIQYTNDLFNQSTKSKLTLHKKFNNYKLIQKSFSGLNFITNGDDYYFPKCLNVHILASVVLLDYFNCAVDKDFVNSLIYAINNIEAASKDADCINNYYDTGNNPDSNDSSYKFKVFNKIVTSKVLSKEETDSLSNSEDIFNYLNKLQSQSPLLFNVNDLLEHSQPFPFDTRTTGVDDSQCCPRHHSSKGKPFVPNKNKRVVDYANKKNFEETQKKLKNGEVFLFGKKVVVDFKSMKVDEKKVFFDKMIIPRVHFAGCDNDEPPCWSGESETSFIIEEDVDCKEYCCVPPIYYASAPLGFHLRLDIFNNNYIRLKDEDGYKYSRIYSGVSHGTNLVYD